VTERRSIIKLFVRRIGWIRARQKHPLCRLEINIAQTRMSALLICFYQKLKCGDGIIDGVVSIEYCRQPGDG